jgi:hypothetical protein
MELLFLVGVGGSCEENSVVRKKVLNGYESFASKEHN